MVRKASDDEREECLRTLRAAFADGRIDERELERRAGRATLAGSRVELALLTRDLPRTRPPAWARTVRRVDRVLLRAHAAAFTAGNGSLVAVWAATGEGGFWPAWLLVPWTPVIALHAAGSWNVRKLLRRRGAGPRRAHPA